MSATLPFFPPAVFDRHREMTLRAIFDVGTGPDQRFFGGDAVAELERRIAAAAGVRHAVACANATGGLALVLDAWGITAGDEVIVPAYGCQPVVDTVVEQGATPVFADVDPRTFTIDPAAVAAAVTPRTAAILPAHVFATMADMPALVDLARRHGLRVLEDAAVAQGATLAGRAAGAWGDAGVYSFSQFKPFGAIGEGGIVLTDDEPTAIRCRRLRRAGTDDDTGDGAVGRHSRMDEVLARFLSLRWAELDRRLSRKREIAAFYQHRLRPVAEAGVVTLPLIPDSEPWCHVYAIMTDRRDELRAHLAARGIGSHIYYPVTLPMQPAFAAYASGMTFPHAEAVARDNLALPVWPELSENDLAYISDSIIEFFGRHTA